MGRTRVELYCGLQKLLGSEIRRFYSEMTASESWTQEQARKQAERLLARTLRHAATRVPYYQQRCGNTGSLRLSEFPILRRQDVRQHFDDLMLPETQREYNSAGESLYGWKKVQTGGSSGEPTTVLHSRTYRDKGRAGRLYSQRICGFEFGTPYVRLWGSMKEINEMKDSWQLRLTRVLSRETLLNAFRMDEPTTMRYLTEMERLGARHLMAYVDCAVQLARIAEAGGGRPPQLSSVMACAGTVLSEHRALLGRVFGARVHNKYGSRECGEIACECPSGGMHVYWQNVALEIVNDHGAPVPSGAAGRILVTLLENDDFPLIRYEIGDIGAWRDGTCACGRPGPLLDRVEGRKSEFILGAGGAYVSPTFIRHLIGVVHNPGITRRFQMEQIGSSKYELRLEVDRGAAAETRSRVYQNLLCDLRAVLGEDSEINLTEADRLEESASGKFLYVLNRMAEARAERTTV